MPIKAGHKRHTRGTGNALGDLPAVLVKIVAAQHTLLDEIHIHDWFAAGQQHLPLVQVQHPNGADALPECLRLGHFQNLGTKCLNVHSITVSPARSGRGRFLRCFIIM